MRGSSQTSGGSEGSFTDGALVFLRSSVANGSTDVKKAPKPAGKAFQTAHDSSGWDRKARWQRAFNLARSKMGVQGMDESVDKWGAGGRDSEGGDRRSASAQPARRGSTLISTGGFALAGAPGTIVELRTPVALKEHLKRGKGAREVGIQLVALEGAGHDLPLSEQDAAALVAQFDQRHQMLGTAPSPGRQALRPADRALKAWTNNTAVNNNVGSDRSCSSTSLASNTGNSCADSAANSNTGSGGSQASGSAVAARGCSSAGCSVDAGTYSGANKSAASLMAVIAPAPGTATAIASCSSSVSPAANMTIDTHCSSIGGFSGGSGGSFSGSGNIGGGLMLLRRYSESGAAPNVCDCALSTFRRNSGAAPESIIARQPQPLQRADSGSLHRPAHEVSLASRSIERQTSSSGEPPSMATTAPSELQSSRGSVSRQCSGVPAGTVLAAAGHPEHPGAWVTIPTIGSFDASCVSGGGALRPTPRPSSAGRRAAQPQTWLTASTAELLPSAGAYGDGSGSSSSCGGASNGSAAAGAPSPFSSLLVSDTASLQPLAQRHMVQALPVLQVPPLAAEGSSSPSRFIPVEVHNPLSTIGQYSAVGGGSSGISGSEAELNDRYLSLSPSAALPPQSQGVQLVATSPVGAVTATAGGNTSSYGGGGGLVPTPPSASLDSLTFTGGLRRPRPRISTTGGATVNSPSETSPPLSQGICIPANLRSGVDSTAAAVTASAAAPPSPSRLVMHTSPASPSSYSPTRASVTAQGHRRNTISSYSQPSGPQQSSSSLAPRAAAQPTTPSPPSLTPASINYRRVSMTGLALQSGGSSSSSGGGGSLARPTAAASQPHSRSQPQSRRSPMQQAHHHQQQQLQLQPSVSTAPVWQTGFKPIGASAAPRGRLTDDGGARLCGSGGGSTGSNVRTVASPTAKACNTPVSDAELAGLREVVTEVADELSREAEMAAMERQALAQRSRMRVSDSGKPRHISLPGDPWRKWG
ncbi:hypothetical protein Vafri_13052 [Volvox africanus]|uniref:Uncharacterized protein n=1 Tax=Volvox africanus TaxID=51714 RepID=A0A8J4BAZ8_9CHLO|nr:hypothetical protein Vafri_13052 [Volvox africanus]